MAGAALGPRWTTGRANGGGTIQTGVTPWLAVFAVEFGFKGVIDVVDVEVVPGVTMVPSVLVPLPVVPVLSLSVPSPNPLPPKGDVGVGEKNEPPPKDVPNPPPDDCKKNPLVTNTIWIWLTPETVPTWRLMAVKLGVLMLKTTRGANTWAGTTTGFNTAQRQAPLANR